MVSWITAILIIQKLTQQRSSTAFLPPYSPDLSPIECNVKQAAFTFSQTETGTLDGHNSGLSISKSLPMMP